MCDEMEEVMIIVAGLGNPTDKYRGTRHNVGFDTIDKLADKYDISVDTYKYKSMCGKGIIGGEKVLLMKPQTFMNNSGEAIREALDFFKVDPEEELIVIYDDITLAEGRLRIRGKGSAGGHNGIKSIIAHTGTEKFKRIRVGIGEKPPRMDLADYVLGRFSPDDRKLVDNGIDNAIDAVKIIIEQDIDKAMNKFN
jgi:PTH1 family peptidyl-tRNA hydrolase